MTLLARACLPNFTEIKKNIAQHMTFLLSSILRGQKITKVFIDYKIAVDEIPETRALCLKKSEEGEDLPRFNAVKMIRIKHEIKDGDALLPIQIENCEELFAGLPSLFSRTQGYALKVITQIYVKDEIVSVHKIYSEHSASFQVLQSIIEA